MAETPDLGLVRRDHDPAGLEAFASARGGPVGLSGVVADLDRRARRSLAPGRAVHRALTWDRRDRSDTAWWPQGITSSADGHEQETFEGRRLVLVSWYAAGRPGVRISVLDLDSRRYTHVLVVEVDADGTSRPLRAHAGGIVWHEEWLHVAATARGVHTCRLADVVPLPEPIEGCRFAVPVHHAYRAPTGGPDRLRHSFLSLDRAPEHVSLVVGEYGHSGQSRRLARYAVDAGSRRLRADGDGLVRPELVAGEGAVNAQGAVVVDGEWYLTSSRGPRKRGTVWAGTPGALRRHPNATPMGPEDLTWWPSTDLLWSVTEHPRRRWVYCMRRSRFG